MAPHSDFVGRSLPRNASFGSFNLSVLSPSIVKEDYAVVVESEGVLRGLFGDTWPENLTLEENLDDLLRHEKEFDSAQAFAWVIRSSEGKYLGCAYFYPTPEERGTGQIFTWIRDREDRLELLNQFNSGFQEWLGSYLPNEYSLSWKSNDQIGQMNAQV